MDNLKKWIRRILNFLFIVIVAAAIYVGWGKQVDNPDSWFPEWVEEEPAAQTTQSEQK